MKKNFQAFPQQMNVIAGNGITTSDMEKIAKAIERADAPGMSLRAYFAGQALAGILGNSNLDANYHPQPVVEECFDMAEMMVAEEARRR